MRAKLGGLADRCEIGDQRLKLGAAPRPASKQRQSTSPSGLKRRSPIAWSISDYGLGPRRKLLLSRSS